MNDDKKTKKQLTEELVLLRREISKLKASKAGGSALALYTAKASPSYAATRDMTERKHSEETLRESEGLYRALAESAQDFTFIVDKDGYVNYVNTSTANQFRCRPERMVGKRKGGVCRCFADGHGYHRKKGNGKEDHPEQENASFDNYCILKLTIPKWHS